MPEMPFATIKALTRWERARTVAGFALLGAASGAGAMWIVEALSQAQAGIVAIRSAVPGLVFGLLVGGALLRRGLAGPWVYAAYAVASSASCYAAIYFAVAVYNAFNGNMLLIGFCAGLLGSACLTGVSALLFRSLRRPAPCLLMLGAGCVLGGLLAFYDGLVLFASWQAGYAAALAAGLPGKARVESAPAPGS